MKTGKIWFVFIRINKKAELEGWWQFQTPIDHHFTTSIHLSVPCAPRHCLHSAIASTQQAKSKKSNVSQKNLVLYYPSQHYSLQD